MARTKPKCARCVRLESPAWQDWLCPVCVETARHGREVWHDRKKNGYVCAKFAAKLNKEQEDNDGE